MPLRKIQNVHIARLTDLITSALNAPRGFVRIAAALSVGVVTHLLFVAGVGSMVLAMYYGMTLGKGTVPWPYAAAANALLLLQFPVMHSLLLTKRGGKLLSEPGKSAATLSTSTYAIIASIQLLLLFGLWTPSGIVWWRAEGGVSTALTLAYAACWLLVGKATWDAGIEVQSGALGWLSLLADKAPRFPDMPTRGLFAVIRQPIYVSFCLLLWTVPVWTPDQLAVAVSLTIYCLAAPRMKERRFGKRYGPAFDAYRSVTPYAVPRPARRRETDRSG